VTSALEEASAGLSGIFRAAPISRQDTYVCFDARDVCVGERVLGLLYCGTPGRGGDNDFGKQAVEVGRYDCWTAGE
jgi:hypothetical protein